MTMPDAEREQDNMRPAGLIPVSTAGRHAMARAVLALRSVAGTRDYRRFVIVSTARTGSTLLTGLLNSHSQALAFGELFRSPDAIGWDVAPFINRQGAHLLARYRADPVGFLDQRVFKRWPRNYAAVGFKLFYFHTKIPPGSIVWDYLTDNREICILHLKRRNLLAQYYSLQLAHKMDVWSMTRPASTVPAPLSLMPDACARHFASVRDQERECDGTLSGHPLKVLYYEDLSAAQESEVRAIERFLGLKQETLMARTVRQRTAPLSEVIANYEELKQTFVGTKWAEFFRGPAD
jgi:LPS sulfotransferase NodH